MFSIRFVITQQLISFKVANDRNLFQWLNKKKQERQNTTSFIVSVQKKRKKKRWRSCWRSASEIQTADAVCACGHFPSMAARAHVQQSLAAAASWRKNTKCNCSRSFCRFSRQIISGLRPLAPTLRPSRSLWPIITCHSFDLFISSSLGWVEAKRNPLISGSWLCSLHGELGSAGGKQQPSGWRGANWREELILARVPTTSPHNESLQGANAVIASGYL